MISSLSLSSNNDPKAMTDAALQAATEQLEKLWDMSAGNVEDWVYDAMRNCINERYRRELSLEQKESISRGGRFRTRSGQPVWWRVSGRRFVYHAVYLAPLDTAPRTLCGISFEHTAPLNNAWGIEDPSRSVMTCERCAERVYRVKKAPGGATKPSL